MPPPPPVISADFPSSSPAIPSSQSIPGDQHSAASSLAVPCRGNVSQTRNRCPTIASFARPNGSQHGISQGVHRTATTGDEVGADWLIGAAARLGATPTSEDFKLDRLDPLTAYLEIDGARIDGVPVFDAPATSAEGIYGALGRAGGGADIAVAELSPSDRLYARVRKVAARRDSSRLGNRLPWRTARPGLAERRAVSPALRRPGNSCRKRGARDDAGGRGVGSDRCASSPTAAAPRRALATSCSRFPAATLRARRWWL